MFQVQLPHPHTYLVISVLLPCLQLRHQWLLVHYGLTYHCERLISDRKGLKKSHIYQKLHSIFVNIKLCHNFPFERNVLKMHVLRVLDIVFGPQTKPMFDRVKN